MHSVARGLDTVLFNDDEKHNRGYKECNRGYNSQRLVEFPSLWL